MIDDILYIVLCILVVRYFLFLIESWNYNLWPELSVGDFAGAESRKPLDRISKRLWR
jgi:hypothetical protein